MELGILMAPQRNLSSVLNVADRLIADISPSHVWISDRFLDNSLCLPKLVPGSPPNPPGFLDPFLTISAMARDGVGNPEFGIAVTDFVRRSPPDLARACNTLNQILGCPLNIGLGSGELINLKPLGYKSSTTPVSLFEGELERFAEINESGACHSGNYQINLGYNSFPSKIWIGGQRERMLRITAKFADGWLPAWKMPPAEYRDKKATLEKLAAAHGRPCPKAGMFATVAVGESRREVVSQFDSSPLWKLGALELSAELWKQWGLKNPGGDNVKGIPDVIICDFSAQHLREMISSIPVELLDEALFIGSVPEILERLWSYRGAGLEHLAVMPVGDPDIYYPAFTRLCNELKEW